MQLLWNQAMLSNLLCILLLLDGVVAFLHLTLLPNTTGLFTSSGDIYPRDGLVQGREVITESHNKRQPSTVGSHGLVEVLGSWLHGQPCPCSYMERSVRSGMILCAWPGEVRPVVGDRGTQRES
eukprot:GHVS01073143.1.p1 GENE.GHVS01073143.1~~GHVS01073143.1.p1  ORF type:complete len:124 (+),score=9.33 GHVS01073143.1:309-680(+)